MYNISYAVWSMKNAFNKFIKKENGDTNFISIIIILAIVMVVAAIFIGFRTQIVDWVTTTFNDAFDKVKSGASSDTGAGAGAGG